MNGTYIQEPALFRIFYGKNTDFYAHFHEQIEVAYCIEGIVHVMIEGNTYDLYPGDAAVMFPNQHHKYSHPREEAPNGLYLAIFYPSHVEDFYTEFVHQEPVCPIVKQEHLPAFFPEFMNQFYQVCKDRADLRMYKGYAAVMSAHLLEAMELQTSSFSGRVDLTQTVLAYVNQHFRERITVPGIAKELGISQSVLSRIFSEKIKVSFNTYVNDKRITYGKKLIKTTEYSIKEIRTLCGFQSERTFFRAFQNRMDMTPMEYRMENQKKRKSEKNR